MSRSSNSKKSPLEKRSDSDRFPNSCWFHTGGVFHGGQNSPYWAGGIHSVILNLWGEAEGCRDPATPCSRPSRRRWIRTDFRQHPVRRSSGLCHAHRCQRSQEELDHQPPVWAKSKHHPFGLPTVAVMERPADFPANCHGHAREQHPVRLPFLPPGPHIQISDLI
ncbi:hypothetical protein MLD38_034917 [Melastoma candidum]|uniref:Uncharacterized protein n=1 Tax=Melastoma candidum TaxID=119954 RepID=A0ACB9MDU5_9MYRT|nr:hypothetical protein MLD38_034917 [Melastoma candidum]